MELRFQGSWPWRESNSWRQAEQRSRGRLRVGRKKFAANLGNKQKRSSAKGEHFPQCWGRERGLGVFTEGRCPHRLGFPVSGLAFKHNPNTHESLPRIHAASLSSSRVSNNTTASYPFLKFPFDCSRVLLTSSVLCPEILLCLAGPSSVTAERELRQAFSQEWDRVSHLGWYWFLPALIILLVFKHLLLKGSVILMFNFNKKFYLKAFEKNRS